METLIKNVAIIMDGNGRWAKKRRRPRIWGHVRGAHVVSKIAEKADNLNLESLTLYAFSTENWSRSKEEVFFLFKLLDKFLIREKKKILNNNIKFNVIGDYEFLPKSTLQKINELKSLTSVSTGLKLNFAFGYSGRQEIIRSVNHYIKNNPGKMINQNILEDGLYDSSLSDVDLIIRTGGDQRISNFLLWQSSYAELFFTNTYWPEFSTNEFENIINTVSYRERRFGGVGENLKFNNQKEKSILNANVFKEDVGSIDL